MKKILVLYGSYGGGHLSAAKTIQSYIENHYAEEIEVEIIDCIEYINKIVNKVSTDAYKELAKKAPWMWKQLYNKSANGALSHVSTATNKLMSLKLNQLLKESNPDLIISTHPFATQMCAVLKSRKQLNCKLATILTDFHIHQQWLVQAKYNDYFFVSNAQMKRDMIFEGISPNKIFVTGIPISERFTQKFNKKEIYKELGFKPTKQTALFFAGGEFGLGRDSTYMIFKVLIRLFKDLQIIAISGKNKKMNKKFNDLVKSTHSEDRVKVFEYTNMVPEYMAISDVVFTKPGGLTTSECLASALPMAIINPIPGQEEENAQFLVYHDAGIWIKKDDSIARKLKYASRDLEFLKDVKANCKALGRPNSTRDICEILVKEL